MKFDTEEAIREVLRGDDMFLECIALFREPSVTDTACLVMKNRRSCGVITLSSLSHTLSRY